MNRHDDYRRELRAYLTGLGLAVLLSVLAFGAVGLAEGVPGAISRLTVMWTIGLTAAVQVVVHFHYFLHIDFTQSKRDDLRLILFSALIVLLMVAGTLWILGDLRDRMMAAL